MIDHAPSPTFDVADDLGRALSPYIHIQDITTDTPEQGYIRYRGTFIGDLAKTFDPIREIFEARGFTPMIREDENGTPILLAMPQVFHKTPTRWQLNLILFIATIFTTLLVGAGFIFETSISGITAFIREGAPFSVSILLILGAHELGHYFAARYHGVNVTLPYFIPFPSIIGTMGAVILQKEPPKNTNDTTLNVSSQLRMSRRDQQLDRFPSYKEQKKTFKGLSIVTQQPEKREK